MAAARLLYGGHLRVLQNALARNVVLLGGIGIAIVLNVAPWPAD